MKDNKIIREDFKTLEEVIYERDVEIKKLLEDKIKLLEKIVEMHELNRKQPLFMMNGNPNVFQEGKK
jgi:hypothetical protein